MKPADFLRSIAPVLFHRSRVEAELEEELRAHIEARACDLEQSGLSKPQAERRARVEFGGYENFREECRESMGVHFLDVLTQDIGYGARLLRKSPVFAVVTVLTLALGIGATTALFTLINGVLLRPMPYGHAEQLVDVSENNPERGITASGCSYPDIDEFRRGGIFAAVGGAARHALTLTGVGDPTEVATVSVTPEIFPLLNVSPISGRYLLPEDDKKGAAPAVVMSEGLWRTRFGGAADMVGNSVVLDQRSFTVVGIMPASFQVPIFGGHQEVWIPVVQDPLFSGFISNRGLRGFFAIARLNSGESIERAQSEVESVCGALAKEFPADDGGFTPRLIPLQESIFGDVRTPLLILLGAVGLVLVLACVNIANLVLARGSARTRELALRQALGAGRGRIVRQLLTESTLLGFLGSVLGVALAYFSGRALTLLLPRDLPATHSVQIDFRVLGFALAISLCAVLAFGLVPALLATDSNLQSNLKDLERSGSSIGRSRIGKFLATAEVGLATVLVIGAGLLTRSLITMTSVNPGFAPAHILKANISLPRYQYSTPQQWAAFCNELLERIQAQPNLQESALNVPSPLADNFVELPFSIPDHAPLPAGTPSTAHYVSVSPEYFHLMGIPLLRGRAFDETDSDKTHRVALISDWFARFYFKDEDPIGKKLACGFPPDSNVTREIVGIVGDVRDASLTKDPAPMMYVPFAQAPFWGANLIVKSTSPTVTLVANIREVVWSLDKNLPVTDVITLPEAIDQSVAQPRFHTWLVGGFGAVALLLAAIGVFGVMSYSVAGRTKEFGVRAALGAAPSSIKRMILVDGAVLACAGLGLGAAAAAGLSRFLKGELYGITSYDPATFIISGAVLLAVAVLACYIPARRAMNVDPMVALRHE